MAPSGGHFMHQTKILFLLPIASIFMAAQDGTLGENSGQTAETILANYVPLDNDDPNEESSDEEDEAKNEEENESALEQNGNMRK